MQDHSRSRIFRSVWATNRRVRRPFWHGQTEPERQGGGCCDRTSQELSTAQALHPPSLLSTVCSVERPASGARRLRRVALQAAVRERCRYHLSAVPRSPAL